VYGTALAGILSQGVCRIETRNSANRNVTGKHWMSGEITPLASKRTRKTNVASVTNRALMPILNYWLPITHDTNNEKAPAINH
jgi:hypothetical protein